VLVSVRVSPSYSRREVLPLVVVSSTRRSTLNGFAGDLSSTVRSLVDTRVRPAGVVVVARATYGAAIPQRGSPASVVVLTVPSGWIVFVVPSGRYSITDLAPDGSVVEVRVPPPGSCSASKRVTLFMSDVRVMRCPFAVRSRVSVTTEPLLSSSVLSRPVAAS
jgi:hypothetical protein